MSEKNKENEENIIERIKKYIESVAGDKTNEDLEKMLIRLGYIKDIIEKAYQIGEFVKQYEEYKQQQLTASFLKGITGMMIPEFKEFLASKFKAKLEEESKSD